MREDLLVLGNRVEITNEVVLAYTLWTPFVERNMVNNKRTGTRGGLRVASDRKAKVRLSLAIIVIMHIARRVAWNKGDCPRRLIRDSMCRTGVIVDWLESL